MKILENEKETLTENRKKKMTWSYVLTRRQRRQALSSCPKLVGICAGALPIALSDFLPTVFGVSVFSNKKKKDRYEGLRNLIINRFLIFLLAPVVHSMRYKYSIQYNTEQWEEVARAFNMGQANDPGSKLKTRFSTKPCFINLVFAFLEWSN